MDKNIGKKLDGRYEISELIGMGGMADVYKAIDLVDDKIVAVKILKNEFSANEEFLRRFRNESKAIAVLSHPNIVKVLDVGFTDKIQFIVMEYIDGITLKEYIEQEGILKWKDCVHFTTQILRALQHAHDRGIVHRDIKPQNIMLFTDGTIKVMDFGIAKFAREEGKSITDKAIGSVHYISPEQARGDLTDDKSDIYSVGVMMFEMLTGQKPFDGDNAVSIALMHMQNKPEMPRNINANIPVGLEEILLHAMEKDASRRYQSAAEMIKDIEKFKANPSIVFGYVSHETAEDTGATRFFTPPVVTAPVSSPVAESPDPDEDSTVFEEDYYSDDDFDDDVDNSAEEQDDELAEEGEDFDEDDASPSLFVPILTAVTIALILAAVIFVAAFIIRYLNPDEKDTAEYLMPNLIGMSYDDAVAQYSYLKFTVDTEGYSEFEEGIIYNQDITENRPIKSGQEVNIDVSLGIKLLKVPDVAKMTGEAATSYLKNMGFIVRTNSQENSEVENGYVIDTEPSAGTEVKPDTIIMVNISLGSEETTVRVPNMLGYDFDAAEAILIERGLVVTRDEADSSQKLGVVVGQSLSPQDIVDKGTTILLTVSNGIAPDAEVELLIDVNSKAVGAYVFTMYIDGISVGSQTIDDITLTGGVVKLKIEGSGTKNVAVKLKNIANNQEALIAQYAVDFTAGTYTNSQFNSNAYDEVGGIPVVTTTTAPPIIVTTVPPTTTTHAQTTTTAPDTTSSQETTTTTFVDDQWQG